MRPEKGTYPAFYDNYIPYVKQEDVMVALEQSWAELKEAFSSISKDKEDYAYAPGKWTIKQMLLHISDTERIFSYRALRFARKDPQQVLPFEENDYAAAADVSKRSLADILAEMESVRNATISLFRSFSKETLLLTGNTAAGQTTVLAIGFITCGHAAHHIKILKERY
jgi:hypothetical protein